MLDLKKYIKNGVVDRVKIALDVKRLILNKSDIFELVKEPKVRADFIDNCYREKTSKETWDESYLDKLSYAVVAESFNEDYLLYLNEVAEYIFNEKNKKNSKIKIALGLFCIISIILGFIFRFFTGK